MVRLWSLACFAAMAHALADVDTRFGAVSFAHDGLEPRSFLDTSSPLLKRGDTCRRGAHSCLDVKRGDECCEDTKYCFITDDDELKCCALGRTCPGLCQRDQYRCYTTITASASGTAATPSVTRVPACCSRSCPKSKNFLCPSANGGGCCEYGSVCGDGDCAKAIFDEPTQSGLISAIPEGCDAAGQVPCEDEQGCCNEGDACVQVSSVAMCSPSAATDSDAPVVDESGSELSDGAKAGIAIGAVFGAGIIIAALTWLCIRRRRRRRTETQRSASAANRPAGDNMTELTASTRFPARDHEHGYFGPDAVAGPYTDNVVSSAATSPSPDRGVPTQPRSPHDIHVPVEMDSRAQSPESERTESYYETPMSRFELHGASAWEPYTPPPPRQRSPSLQNMPRARTPRDELP